MSIAASLLAVNACSDRASSPVASPSFADSTPSVSEQPVTVADVLAKDGKATSQAEVRWGWAFEETGAFAPLGGPAGDGVLLAVKEINDAGGFQVGDTIYTIQLLEHDTGSDITTSQSIMTELVLDDGAKVVWGPALVGDAETTVITNQGRVLHLCPCVERELTSLATAERASDRSRWAFQTAPAQSGLYALLARHVAAEYPDFERFAAVCSATDSGRAICKFISDSFGAQGLHSAGDFLLPVGTVDFSAVLTDLRTSEPGVLRSFLDGDVAQFAFIRQAWQQDVGQLYFAPAIPYDVLEGLTGDGIRERIILAGAARTNIMPTSSDARGFFERYEAFTDGELPLAAFASLTTYDAVYMLVAAMQLAGTVEDTSAISAVLEGLHFDGVAEDDLYFSDRHIIAGGADFCTVTHGAYQECHHVLPEDSADN